ncbi:ninein homolog isoform X2 [Prorops nasuta]|uniref:ninein homolog isoform X2 n=1 Tax=Prorops nasuta TaxID=863751 RepID=UPI0034CFECB2
MDDYNGPYEQQLLAVFQSCLQEGYSQLTEADLSSLCEKLNLETRLEELKSCIFNNVSDEKLISYHKFRNGLLTLLGSNEESVCEASKQVTTESLQENSHSKVQQNYTNHSNLQSHKGKKPVDRYNSDFRKILNISPTKNSSATVMQVVSDYLGILTLSDQILHQLFDRLDENEDGLINFDEFSVIFQSHRNSEGPVTLEWGGEHYKNWLKEAEQNTSEIIEMQHLGVAERSAIIEKWKIAGIPRAESLLSDLGINSTSINLADLMTILCDELKSICGPDQNVAQILFRAGAVLYQEQLDNLSACLQAERDNLRLNIAKANDRANALAQELDDCHANQEVISQNLKQAEQRYTDAVKELSEELATEREVNTSNLAAQQSQLQNLQQELHSAKAELANIILENGYVEEENQSLREKNKKLKLTNEELLVEIKSLAAEHDEVQKAERGKQEQVIGLVDRIKQLQSENSLLRDHNDELMMELKDLTKSSMEVKGKLDIFMNSPIRSIQSDESLNSNLSGKRCLVDEDPSIRKIFKHESAPEDLEDELPLPFSPIKILSDLRNLQYTDTDLRNKLLNFLSELEGSVTSNKDKNLIELDECLANFKKSIVVEIKNLLSNHSLENNILANKLQSLIYNLEISASRSLVRTETIANSLASELENSISSNLIKSSNLVIENDGVIQNTDDNFNNVNKKYPFKEVIDPEETEDSSDPNFKDKVTSLRDYPPRKEDFTEERVKNKKEKNCKASNDNVSDEKSEYISLRDYPPLKNDFENKKSDQDEKQQLMERCSELEKSLDMLTVEYEACEEYWAHKLEEERQLFEQEQKVSDDKLAELIIKMAEYEELISQPEKPLNDGHLSPIEEKFSLEQQYLDLEEEYEKWKETLHREITARDEEIKELRQRLQINEVVYVDISVQVPEVEFVRSSPCKNSIESSAIQRLPASNNQVPIPRCPRRPSVHSVPSRNAWTPVALARANQMTPFIYSCLKRTTSSFRRS